MVALPLHFIGQPLRFIFQLFPFQPVAEFVIGKGRRIFPPVLQRLSEREAQVVTVRQRNGWRRLLLPHLGQFGIGKAVGLEVGETPECIPAITPDLIGLPIGRDRLLLPPDGLQGMAIGEVDPRVVRHRLQQRLVGRHRRVEIADRQIFIGIEHFKFRVAGLLGPQFHRLSQRLLKFLPFPQQFGIIILCADIVRFQSLGRFQQEFGIIIGIEPEADFGEQPHRLDMMAFPLEERPAHCLGLGQSTFLNEAGDGLQLGWQGRQIGILRPGKVGLCIASGGAVQFGQSSPAGRQRAIVGYRGLIGSKRLLAAAKFAKAVAPLLPGAAIAGVQGDQPGQC